MQASTARQVRVTNKRRTVQLDTIARPDHQLQYSVTRELGRIKYSSLRVKSVRQAITVTRRMGRLPYPHYTSVQMDFIARMARGMLSSSAVRMVLMVTELVWLELVNA